MVHQAQMERKLMIEELQRSGAHQQASEPSHAASIQNEAQHRTTNFATPFEDAAAQVKKKLRHEQQIQEALRYFDEKDASAAKQISTIMGSFDDKHTRPF